MEQPLQQVGGGSFAPEETENPEENTPPVDEQDDNSSQDTENDDPPAKANTESYHVTIKQLCWTSSTKQADLSGSASPASLFPCFDVTAKNPDNGEERNFDDTITVTGSSTGYRGFKVSKSNTKAQYCVTFKYEHDNIFTSTKRYLDIKIWQENNSGADHEYFYFGVSSSNANSECRTYTSGQPHCYLYNNLSTTNESTAKTNAGSWLDNGAGGIDTSKKMVTWYVFFRLKYKVEYYWNYYSTDTRKDNGTFYAGIGYTLKNPPNRPNYTFKGWATSRTGTTLYTSREDKDCSGDQTYYAIWEAIRYKITLDSNFPENALGTSDVSPAYFYVEGASSAKYKSLTGSTTVTYTAPKCTGYELGSWYGPETPTGSETRPYMLNDGDIYNDTWEEMFERANSKKIFDLTLKARWNSKSYSVTLNKNGGTGGSPDTVTVYYRSTKGSLYIEPPKRSCYTFSGWTTTQNGSTILIDESGVLCKSITGYTNSSGVWDRDGGATVYALWIGNVYKISLNWNAPPDKTDTIDGEFYVRYATGWSINSSANTYTTTGFIDPSHWKRTGYTFAGFYTTKTGGTLILDTQGTKMSTNTQFSANTTIYAHWTANTVSITVKKMVSDYSTTYAQSANGGTMYAFSYYDSSNTPKTKTTSSSSSSWSFSALKGYKVVLSAVADKTTDAEYGYHYHFNGFSTSSSYSANAVLMAVESSTPGSESVDSRFVYQVDGSASVTLYAWFERDFELSGGDNQQTPAKTKFGLFPQTRVSYSITSGTNVGTMSLPIKQGSSQVSATIYKYNSNYYAYLDGKAYLFEPITWIVKPNSLFSGSSRGVQGFTYEWQIAVSEKVLLGGQVVDANSIAQCIYDWKFENSLMHQVITTLNNLDSKINPSVSALNGTKTSATYQMFGSSKEPDKVASYDLSSTATNSTNLRVASLSEINDTMAGANKKSDFSDFAADLVATYGDGAVTGDYWTRDLGTYTQEGKIIDAYGGEHSRRLDAVCGVRFAITLPRIVNFNL